MTVAEEAGDVDGYLCCHVKILFKFKVFPDLPLIILKDLVVQECAEVEKVAQRGDKYKAHAPALKRLEVFTLHQKHQREYVDD